MATSLEPSTKEAKLAIYDHILVILWRCGENWSSKSWVFFAQEFI